MKKGRLVLGAFFVFITSLSYGQPLGSNDLMILGRVLADSPEAENIHNFRMVVRTIGASMGHRKAAQILAPYLERAHELAQSAETESGRAMIVEKYATFHKEVFPRLEAACNQDEDCKELWKQFKK